MKFLKNFDWSAKSILKVIGLGMLGIVALTIAISLIGFALKTAFQGIGGTNYTSMDYGRGGGAMFDMQETSAPMMAKSSISPIPPYPGQPTGDDAENYEVKSFNASIRTRKFDNACKTFTDLKRRSDVIFESSDIGEYSCYFSFKVKKNAENDVIAIIERLKPENFNENIQTIKGIIEEHDKQLDILNNKLTSIEETLESAQKAYKEVQELATEKQDVESLAKIIDSRLNLIEKLTNERLQIKEQIDRYNKSKTEQMDRLSYSFFNINIQKDQIFDWKQIKNSWKYELRTLVDNFNDTLEGITLSLLTYLIRFVQIVIYILITIILLKVVWAMIKKIWKWGKR